MDGSLPFKCTPCCLPGIQLPKFDVRSTIADQKLVNAEEHIDSANYIMTAIGDYTKILNEENSILSCKESRTPVKNRKNSEQLKQDNFILKEAQTDMKMKLVDVDNNNLNTKIQELQQEISILHQREVRELKH